ncbi:prolipoprotein diacylglyceryl transferase [Haloechinothrix salitolerans]|uniref:Phosphatidylglycerol--prolipoprotein diacylglyceryl transferase n=1 Tax=Haloechinothrix salitolerans TaxID=926830 RepID=A0ABW2C2U5_9PSEU
MNIAAGPVLASFPSPPQGVWQLDLGFVTLPIRAYALCIIAGIIVAIWWGDRRWVARGGTKGTIIDIAVFAVPFGLVGGRLYHVLTDYHRYFGEGANPIDALKIWDGGLGIWGAIALGAVGAWIACRTRGIPLPAVADAVAPGIVVAQAIGRLGNYFNQELYGRETDVPWGLEIYQRINPETGQLDQLLGESTGDVIAVVHPTFLYELLWNLGVAVLLVWADRRFRLGGGRVFALYVAGYTAGRFWIEMMRSDPATDVFGVRINVWVSALVFLGAVTYLVLTRKRGREAPEVAQGKVVSAESGTDTGDGDSDRSSDGDGPSDGRRSSDSDASDVAASGEPTESDAERSEQRTSDS